ncbi:MAG: hypothetical protein ACYS0G_12080 [Planctomycetota bacterium]|jgi:flagellar motility protein MotE (MotC chaperone)
MRTAWSVVSFLAVVHLLALGMFIGWLWQSNRLSADRVESMRALFAMTVPEARAAAERAVQETRMQAEGLELEARQRRPPLSSEAQIELVTRVQQQTEQSARRLNDVKEQLLRQLALATEQVDVERAALDAERRAWEEGVGAARERKADDQFTKAVKLLESLPPKEAKRKIVELVDSGKTDQAVAYLDAMSQRAAGKILAQFKTDQENELATELLERLRTFGVRPGRPDAAKDASNADAVANAR